MTTLLVVNSILVATCLYFIKDFHSDFKDVKRSLQGLKEKFGEHSSKVNTEIHSVEKRVGKLESKAK